MILALLALGVGMPRAWAGSEDRKQRQETPPPAEVPPPPPVVPDDSPDPTLEAAPEEKAEAPVSAPRPKRRPPPRAMGSMDPDENINWQRVTDWVKRGGIPDLVAPPALGVRGYRSNMIGVGVGDRTPGYGAFVEYSWNRIGFGMAASYKPLTRDRRADSYGFWSVYFNYRWLPWDISPYLHGGPQFGTGTPHSFGLMGGAGIDARIYYGLTLQFGYTFHSIAEKGWMGGALGWAF